MRETVNVLLVEDNEMYAELLWGILKGDPHFDYHFAPTLITVKSAQAVLASVPVDLIILDLVLPDGDGVATVRRIRESAPRTPLVVVTGLSDLET